MLREKYIGLYQLNISEKPAFKQTVCFGIRWLNPLLRHCMIVFHEWVHKTPVLMALTGREWLSPV